MIFKSAFFLSLAFVSQLFSQNELKGVDPEITSKYSYLSTVDAKMVTKYANTFKETTFEDNVRRLIGSDAAKKFVSEDDINAVNKALGDTHLTLMYFFSSSMPASSWNNFFQASKKLSNSMDYYGILRGVDPSIKTALNNDLNQTMRAEGVEYRMKVQPMIYRDLHIEHVPSFVLAECHGLEFRSLDCDYLYRMDGDVSLSAFFEKLSDVDKKYSKYYHTLVGD